MNKVFVIGECMVELQRLADGQIQQGFAGDVFNTAVYLKRAFPDIELQLITAIGLDSFSDDMLQFFEQESLGTANVFRSQTKVPGLYAIQTDSTGERSFTYWRENSAARHLMQFIDQALLRQFSKGDMLVFSGISLAIIPAAQRPALRQLLHALKAAGVVMVFDPNYRPRLWQNAEDAKQQFALAWQIADIALPGIDDFAQLYQLTSPEAVQQFCAPFHINELVIKDGKNTVYCLAEQHITPVTITPVSKVVDTTSAGDAFNGVYLGARLTGSSMIEAVTLASTAAGEVIQHKGAITPRASFVALMTAEKSKLANLQRDG